MTGPDTAADEDLVDAAGALDLVLTGAALGQLRRFRPGPEAWRFARRLARRPGKLALRGNDLLREYFKIAVGTSEVAAGKGDRRFSDAAWSDNPVLHRLVQAYLATAQTEAVPTSFLAADGAEMVLVIGGDGTLLRAAELARPARVPLLGVNLGHVGFLAEAEPEDLSEAVDQVVEGKYVTEQRMTVDVTVRANGDVTSTTWALNEASVEKVARERMLDMVIEVDGRPLSRWGCDGVVFATPTG